MKRALLLVAFAAAACSKPTPPPPSEPAPSAAAAPAAAAPKPFAPPERDAIPEGPFGESVKRGYAIFHDTPTNAARYAGNGLSCKNCHLDDGRKENSTPMWAAWAMYPQFRKKNGHVNTLDERLRGCFTFSMNAPASEARSAPPPNDPILVDLQAYMFWLAKGVPVGEKVPGRGYPEVKKPSGGFSAERGAKVYAEQCALCHGDDGQGTKLASGAYAFPPLWGADSFNWGAGMHRINTAAAVIKANMPLSKPSSLTDQEAWDVAAYVDSKPRPADPRMKKGVAAADEEFHQEECAFGEERDGRTLGEGVRPEKQASAK